MLAIGGTDEGCGESFGLESEIKKTRSGDLNWFAAISDIELLDDLGGEFTRV